jgi:hypothetical protein
VSPRVSLSCRLARVSGSFLSLGRALALTTARAFLPSATALLAGVVLFAAIPFGGDGVRPVHVVSAMARWPFFRAGTWALWVALSAPVSARLVDASWVRSMPVRTWHAVLWLVGLGLLAQGPWVLLFAAGEGIARGAANGLVAEAIGFALATGAIAPATVAVILALVPLPSLVVFPLAVALAASSARRAWIAGPREPPAPWRILRPSPAIVAVSVAALVDLVRGERLRLARAVALALVAGAALRLLERNDPLDDVHALLRAEAVLAIPAAVAAAWLTCPIVVATGGLRPLVATMGRSVRVLPAGAALAVAALFFAFGACAGLAVGASAVAPLAAWTTSLALLVLGRARRTTDPTYVVVVGTLLGAAALVLVLVAGRGALPIAAAAAVVSTARRLS